MDLLKQKIKQKPEDFVVEEVLPLNLKERGDYSYYILEKRGRNTLDVLSEVASKLKIPLSNFGIAGLKDKRAITSQYVSILNGPEVQIGGKGWRLRFVGRGDRGIEIGDAKGNIFTLTIRDVDAYRVAHNLWLIEKIGFANYFGEQRFLSDLNTSRPIALLLMENRFMEALKEYFTQSNCPYLKRRLKRLWGRWSSFLQEARHLSNQERVVIKVLARTKDPVKAFRAFPKNLKLMFFFSYQSLLWNRCLAKLISQTDHVKAPFVRRERLAFYRRKTPIIEELENSCIPYVSSEALKDERFSEVLEKIIEEQGLKDKLDAEVAGLKVFNPGTRKAIVRPERLQVIEQGRKQLTVRFFLPSGSYATILIRKALYL